jgi:hypothetical protein
VFEYSLSRDSEDNGEISQYIQDEWGSLGLYDQEETEEIPAL